MDSTEGPDSAIWSPPEYNFDSTPLEVDRCDLSTVDDTSNFARNMKWCPDGSEILAQCEDHTFRFFQRSTREQRHRQAEGPIPFGRTFTQASPVLGFAWYPRATSFDPASYCFVASVRECPVKLLDASTGKLRASYSIVDHRERQVAPHSLEFDSGGQTLYCGFEDAIEVFDIQAPSNGTRVHTTPSKKSKDGLKGIISALAHPMLPPGSSGYFAAGSFTPTSSNIFLYDSAQLEPFLALDGGPCAGVTQLKFNPAAPQYIYAAHRGRGTGKVYVWDLRGDCQAPLSIFAVGVSSGDTHATERTNQRLHFDMDISGRYLAFGDQAGNVSVFDALGVASNATDPKVCQDVHDGGLSVPILTFPAHRDAITSVGFSPTNSLLASASGSRHFVSRLSESDTTKPLSRDSTIAFWSRMPDGR